MRLWSLHPRYFDRQALTACWREALLAQAVILGRTRGYTAHPQLRRFSEQEHPERAAAAYLAGIVDEADARGYHFDREKMVASTVGVALIAVTDGQVAYEWSHLRAKLERRSPEVALRWREIRQPEAHPLFSVVPGPVADWERIRG
ncbi:pyrimidine dimer DNA glycosylase/endonuclease V [Leifsonia sp. Root112D2]|uniref:pyrimidine dimer DNA glycosylase/endonuclease V n=1 Tax=Leifsonia sp. Root112D2 TaxID=1736426 RepID=UPI0006F513E1|nr:pyrimidine dimer DNA glycosylase/endonuclease V [Leifsonia sp. Root112D2]KQV06609.1 hypothetical protein ASC63_04090 [Leifsonia sp. Root112D2]